MNKSVMMRNRPSRPGKRQTAAMHAVDLQVGSRIRLERNAKGFTQERLANEIGVSFQQVQKYEKGTNRVGAGRLTAIAAVLEIPVNKLIGDALESTKNTNTLDLMNQPHAIKLLRLWQIITPPQRASMIALIETLASPK